tara:strand:+ start:3180 stop:4232 length:1053 start_codon:yes stop_codon:yes gene_type:complete
MNRVLVTGGAGFIGSHTCLSLIQSGYDIYIIDSYINSSPKSLQRVKEISEKNQVDISGKIHIFKGDLRDRSFVENIFENLRFQGKQIDGVIHFAGLKSVSESIKKPLEYWDYNVKSTLNLLQVMQKFNCKTIVFSSSATIYDQNNDNKIKENNKVKPINPYGETKLVIEKLLNDLFNSTSGWRIANLRYFNPIGAHDLGLIGEDPKGKPNNIFPTLMQVALGNLSKIKIFGNDWPTKDGTAIRDYIHVMDLAEGHIFAYEFLKEHKPQIINLNLGTGLGTTVLELINIFQEENKINIPFEFIERRKGDYGVVVADNSLAISLLKWQPKRNLRDMCKDGWNWQAKNPLGYQ